MVTTALKCLLKQSSEFVHPWWRVAPTHPESEYQGRSVDGNLAARLETATAGVGTAAWPGANRAGQWDSKHLHCQNCLAARHEEVPLALAGKR